MTDFTALASVLTARLSGSLAPPLARGISMRLRIPRRAVGAGEQARLAKTPVGETGLIVVPDADFIERARQVRNRTAPRPGPQAIRRRDCW